MKILHAFADKGIESYELQKHGEVTRVGISPESGAGNVVKANGNMLPFRENTFDFGLFHPPCQHYSRVTPDRSKHERTIPKARKEAKRVCRYYAIENVRGSELKDPVILNGDIFGKSFEYERHFETNYEIEQPEIDRNKEYPIQWGKNTLAWASQKGYRKIPVSNTEVMRHGIPRCYIRYILKPLDRKI